MNLNEEPDNLTWPETHYVFIESVGPFQETAPKAWQDFHQVLPRLLGQNKVVRYMSLYKAGPKIYRAGVALAAPPESLPQELRYEKFAGGKYGRFVLTGPYTDLGAASGRVLQIISEKKIKLRDDYFIENYVNDPRTTDEKDLITEILVPTG